MNVVFCAFVGRLLHHLDQNQVFNCSTMQVLVLDEADRCLDMGFEQAMNAIIEHLPPERQTFLYSATQTRSVKDLARLSLNDPVYVAPHEQSAFSTPDALTQNYVIVNLEDKITMLWSFLKTHLKQKCIVFMSTCKQVKYIYEIFHKLRPGCSLLALYGSLHQARRKTIYDEFCRKSNVVLFATDVASRGLDFPTVNWVVQLDCPEDATAYIHRAGRTARNAKHGEGLLVLLPSEEEAMLEQLKERKIPINKISIDPRRLFSPRLKMEGFLAQSQELKESAQRAFRSYVKSVCLMKNKKVFNVDALDTDAYALSLGMVVVPRIRFLDNMKKAKKKMNGGEDKEIKEEEESDDEDDEEEEKDGGSQSDQSESEEDEKTVEKPKKKISEPIPVVVKVPKENFAVSSSDSEDSDGEATDNFMTIKRRDHEIPEDSLPVVPSLEEEKNRNKKPITKAALAKRVIRKKIMANTKTTFDDEGGRHVDTAKQLQSDMAKEYQMDADGGINIERAKDLMREEDKFDKARFKQMVKARHKEAKQKSKQAEAGEQEQFDDFGSDEESDGPDMSWLPDPDKIYGEKAKSDGSASDYEVNEDDVSEEETNFRRRQLRVVNSSDESDEEPIHKPKRKLLTKKTKKRQAAPESEDDRPDLEDSGPSSKKAKKLTAKLSVNEAEMLAMKLLTGA